MDSIGSNTSTQVLNFRDLIRRAAARNNIDDRWCAWPGKRRRASLYLICETPVFAFHLHVVFCITWTGAKHINSRHLRVFIRVSVLLNARYIIHVILLVQGVSKKRLGKPSKKINRIFHDIVQNSFATYPPYLIMTYYIHDIVIFFRHLPTFK